MYLKKFTVVAAISICLCGSVADAASILVFGDRENEQSRLTSVLTSLGNTVVNARTNMLPTNLSMFDTIWGLNILGTYGGPLRDQLIDYVANGGGLYMTAERPCCEVANTSVQQIVNANLAVGSIQVGRFGDVFGGYTYNSDAIGNIDADLAIGWVPEAPGQISGVSGRNVVATSNITGRAVAAAWDENDFVSDGRIVVFGDVNWLEQIDVAEAQVIANTQEFLFDGFVGTNPNNPSPVPLPAGGLLLLTGFAGIAGLKRWKKRAVYSLEKLASGNLA